MRNCNKIAFTAFLVLGCLALTLPVTNLMKTMWKKSPKLFSLTEHIRNRWLRHNNPKEVVPSENSFFTCGLCKALVPLVRILSKIIPQSLIKTVATAVCLQLDLAPESRKEEICPKIIDSYADSFVYIAKNSEGSQVCALIAPDCEESVPGLGEWEIDLKGEKQSDEEIIKMRGTVPANVPTTKVLQFTDIHMDLHYKDGGNSDCGSGIPICCRESDGPPANDDVKAGKFGHWMCALPMETTEEIFKHARNEHSDAKYIFVTGDYIHSGVWLYNKEENVEHISWVTRALTDAYQSVPSAQTKMYPLTGNHEPHVVNLYAPPELWEYKDATFDLRWMYSAVLANFLVRDPDLITPEEQERFLQFGYYVAYPEPGVRILAINTNLAYGENFWLGYAPLDPGGQLQWLADELWKAEESGDKVIIIGHEEPGSCWKFWSGKFNEIVDRFEGTIMGQFYGHSHRPQFRLAFRNGTVTPASASFIAGSALTDSGNPSYSVFHLDGQRAENNTWNVVRQELITLKLQESNKAGIPLFEKLVDTKDSFGLNNLTPAAIFEFAKKLICEQELMDKYMLFHHRGTDSPSYYRCMIDDSCREGHLCNMVSSNALDSTACEYLKNLISTTDCNKGQ